MTNLAMGTESNEKYTPKENKESETKSPASSNSKSLYNQVVDITRECLSGSTSHGVPNIARLKSTPLRILWLISLLASTGYCLYCVAYIINDFLSYPVVSSVSSVDELSTDFPTIMICSLNPFNTDSEIVVSNLSNIFTQFPILTNVAAYRYSFFATETLKSYMHANEDEGEYVYNMGYQLSKSLISCQFNGIECQLSDFKRLYVHDYINCYKFNSNGSLSISQRGFSYGLRLELYLGNSSSPDDYSYLDSRGIRFMVMNTTFGDGFIYEQGADAAPGLTTNVQINKNYYNRLGYPYSNCIYYMTAENPDQTPTMKLMFSRLNQTRYNQIYCQNLCLQVEVIKRCGCFLFRYPFTNNLVGSINSSMFCRIEAYMSCAQPAIYQITTDTNACKSDCPRECEYFEYENDITMAEYMSRSYWAYQRNYSSNYVRNGTSSDEIDREELFQKLSQIESIEEARESTLAINFYLNKLGYTATVESSMYSSNSLLSDIGGNLGLFIGISILSTFEIVELVYLIVECLIQHWMANRAKKQVDMQPVDPSDTRDS